jgi:hypothetical protein
MKKAKIFAVGAALLIGMSGEALAQQRQKGDAQQRSKRNPIQYITTLSSEGGARDSGIRTGSMSNTEKIFGNHDYQRER